MKLVHINLNEGILVDAINCTEWVIESPEYFSEYVMELQWQGRWKARNSRIRNSFLKIRS